MKIRLAAGLLLLAAWLAPVTAASQIYSPDEAAVSELGHDVDIKVDGGFAVVEVTRTVKNDSDEPTHVIVPIENPRGAIATGLEMHKVGSAELQLVGPYNLALILPDVPAGATRKVSYTLELELERRLRQLIVWLSEPPPGALAPKVRHRGRLLKPVLNDVWDPYVIPRRPPQKGRGSWGAVDLGDDTLWRIDIEAPEAWSAEPSPGRVVFVVDASRSQRRRGVDNELRMARAFIESWPRARYELIFFDRTSRQLQGHFAPSRETLARIDQRLDAPRELDNGSCLSCGLRLAGEALAAAPMKGTSTVVVMTDGGIPLSRTPSELLDALGEPPTAVHLLVVSGRQRYGAIEVRGDEHPLAPLALQRHGVPKRVAIPEKYPNAEEIAVSNLVRPVRLDHLTFSFEKLGSSDGVRTLPEGIGAHYTGIAAGKIRQIGAHGLLWAEPWRVQLSRDIRLDRMAAILALQDVDELSAAQKKELARKHAVVWEGVALVADPSGVRIAEPTAYPLRPIGGMGMGVGAGGLATKVRVEQLDLEALRPHLAGHLADCAGELPEKTSVHIATTWDEIVEVQVEPPNKCVAEAMWRARLPEIFEAPRGASTFIVDKAGRLTEAKP